MGIRSRRISDSDIESLQSELRRWAKGELGSKLTWDILEKRSGFTRQALQSKASIKAAYDLAKQALSGGLVRSKEQTIKQNDELTSMLENAKLQLLAYQRKEELWKIRWQQIAFHLREKGHQVINLDKPIPNNVLGPSLRETAKILSPFDKEIPPTGRI